MKRIISTCLATAVLVSGIFTSVGFAKEKDKIQIKQFLINEDYQQPEFITGKLTLPSKNKPESIVKDYISKKNGVKDFVLKKQFKNDQKQTVIKTHQTYNGIKVKGTQQSYIIDEKGVIESVSGMSIPDIGSKIKGSIKISEKEALDIVKKDSKKEFKHSSVEKMILPTKEDAVYTYTVNVSNETPYVESWEYVVNASTGKILYKKDALRYESVSVDGTGILGDTKVMTGYKGTIPDLNIAPKYPYSLADVTKTAPEGAVQRSLKVLTYELTNQTPQTDNLYGTKKISSDNDGHFVEDSQKTHAVDGHYYAGKAYDFYKEKFGRYSYDNAGSDIIANVHAIFDNYGGGEYEKSNACWDPNTNQMYFGDGDGVYFAGLASEPAIMGHEFTHAVVDSEVYLEYDGEAGAIHEGIADLFGEAFEGYVYGRNPDWLKIKECFTPSIHGDAHIDFKNPRETKFLGGRRSYPDHVNNKYRGNEDYRGVHINAAILTKAFSLMSDGGTHHNVNVKGIGIDKLTKIIYKVATEYLASDTTNFNKFAELSLTAAAVLYGEGSEEYKSVKAGFQAVGIPYNVSQWKLNSTLPDFVTWAGTTAMTQVNNYAYAFGGLNALQDSIYSDVWEYNMNNNKWVKKNNMPGKRVFSTATSANGKAYVLFGLSNWETMSGYYTTIDEYDPATDQWTQAAKLPEEQIIPLSTYAANTVLNAPVTKRDGWFAVKTGQLDSGASVTIKIQKSSDNVNFTDYKTLGTINTSFSTTELLWMDFNSTNSYYRLVATVSGGKCPFEVNAPYIRDYASAISYDGKIYILGGGNSATDTPILTMDVYDTATKTWQADQPGISYARKTFPALVTAVVNNQPKIYVFGGGSDKIEVYDINTGTWNHSAGTSPSKFANSHEISGVFYKGKIHFSDGTGETLIYDPVTGSWSENVDVGVLSVGGVNPSYHDTMYSISVNSDFYIAYLKTEKYEPIRINAFENENAIVVQWSKYGNDSNVLSIDGATAYSGTGENFRYTSFANASKKHIMKVTQSHPVYGTISSKSLCTAYQKIGDIDGNNVIDSADVALLKNAVLEAVTLTDLQKVAADIYKDNDINSIDYSILQRYVDYSTEYHSVGTIRFMIYGDVNDDGDIDFKDYDRVYKHVMTDSPLSFAETVTADVNGDGLINSIDLAYIVRYINTDGVIFEAVNK